MTTLRRTPIVAGNWKMHTTRTPAAMLASAVARSLAGLNGVEVVLCPPYTALGVVADALAGTGLALGAQDVHWDREGPFTGEVSATMLVDAGCRYVIVGHSERRAGFGETDAQVNRKARAALDVGLTPIVCVGETLDERRAGRTAEVVRRQLAGSLATLEPALGEIVVAYEPVWAIGTGVTATPDQAQEVHALIRASVGERGGAGAADHLRIQYGGSVKAANAAELFAQPDVDGGLVGGASLDAEDFVAIVRAAQRRDNETGAAPPGSP